MRVRNLNLSRQCAIVSAFLLAPFFMFGTPAKAAEIRTCRDILPTPVPSYAYPVTEQWRHSREGLFPAIRANAPFFWHYVAEPRNIPPLLRKAVALQGLIVGDSHLLNFGLVEYPDGKRKYQLLDFDDGGRGSLFLDIVHAADTVQASPYRTDLRSLWDAYITGLRGEKIEKPKVLEKAESRSEDEYLQLQEDYIAEMTKGSHFSLKAGLKPLSEMDPKTADAYTSSSQKFAEVLNGFKILDVGFFVKSNGGSQGIPRFWFLVESQGHGKNHRQIIEFKTMSEPALDLYQPQVDQMERFHELASLYRSENAVGLHKAVDAGKYQFIARTRVKSFLDLDPDKIQNQKDVDNGTEMSLYMFNRLGRWQGQQNPKLLELLTENEDAMFLSFSTLVNQFIAVMEQQRNK